MTNRAARDDFDRIIADWLTSSSQDFHPERVNDRVIERTRTLRQLPRWLMPAVDLRARLGVAAGQSPGTALLVLGLLILGLVIAAVVGGSARRVPAPFGLAAPGAISFISDGRVVIVDLDGSHRVEIPSDGWIAGRPQFSRLGTKVAFITTLDGQSARGQLHVVDADGANDVTIEADAISISPVSWDPTDQLLTYSKLVAGNEVVVVAHADGSGITQVSPADQAAWAPAFSPDGTRIAYLAGFPTVEGVFVVGADGTGARAIRRGSADSYDDVIHWNAAGSQVVLGIGTEEDHDIVAIDADTSAEQLLVGGPSDDRYPIWAPDGSRLAFARLTSAGAQISVLAHDGRTVRALGTGFITWTPEWSPDATRLIATRVEPGSSTVAAVAVLMDPDGSVPTSRIELGSVPADANLPGRLAAEISWQRRAP